MASCPQCRAACEVATRYCVECGFPVSSVATDSDDPLLGRTLAGSYVVLDTIGTGGMGRVYRAEQKRLSRTVALKVVHPRFSGDPSAARRFINEARTVSQLNHPNVVGIIDFGKTDDGLLYIVMELLRGKTLRRELFEAGTIPPARAVDIATQALAGLAEAHHLGVVHRDVKPENIVLEPTRLGGDLVKVVDFGVARATSVPHMTSPGQAPGTVPYMSPEQLFGGDATTSSDLFSLGVVLFEMLTGALPFGSDKPTERLIRMAAPPPDPRSVAPDMGISPALANIVTRSLEADPKDRFASADELASALRKALPRTSRLPQRASMEMVLCSACGGAMVRSQKFCSDCGTRVGATPHKTFAAQGPPSPRFSTSQLGTQLPLLEREADLEFLSDVRRKGARVHGLRLVGEQGVGRTRLAAVFRATAEAEGDVVASVGPDPWWAGVAYHALRGAIDGLTGGEREGAPIEVRRALHDVFGGGDEAGLSPSERRRDACAALVWALGRACARSASGRALLVVDDLELVDPASAAAIRDVLAEGTAHPVLVLLIHAVTYDPGWDVPSRCLAGLTPKVARSLASGNVLTRRTGLTAAPPGATVPPLHVEELLRYAMEATAPPPATLPDLVSLRMERLAADGRRVLQSVAVLGDGAEEDDIAALSGVPIRPGVAELLASSMIERRGSRLRILHPLMRQIALATIPVSARRDLWRRAYQVAERRGMPLEVRARFATDGELSFIGLALAERVAELAAARGDTESAVAALRAAVALTRSEGAADELDDPLAVEVSFRRKLGEALLEAGQLLEAEGVLRETLEAASGSGTEVLRVLRALGHIARRRGVLDPALQRLFDRLDVEAESGTHGVHGLIAEIRRRFAS